jgi:hypothetical protein
MDLELIGLWLSGGATVAGLIQWAKSFLKTDKTWPTWIWALASVLFAAAYSYSPVELRGALGILATSQLGYDVLIQPIRKKLGGGV